MKKQTQQKKSQSKKTVDNRQAKEKPMVRAPAAQSRSMGGSRPKFEAKDNKFVVVHRELLTGLVGTTGFYSYKAPLNPGYRNTLSWLPNIAQNFELYRFRRLRLRYVPRCGTDTVGSVYVAFDPKADDPAPASELIISTYRILGEDVPWREIVVDVPQEVLGTMKHKYISRGDAHLDLNFVGSIVYAHVGNTSGQALGKLWIEYEVELLNPSTPPEGIVESGTLTGVGTLTGALPFSAANVNPAWTGSLIEANRMFTGGASIRLKNIAAGGYYLVAINFEGTGLGAITRGLIGFTEVWFNFANDGTAVDSYYMGLLLSDGNVNGLYDLNITTVATTLTKSKFAISRVSPPPVWP